MIADLDVLRHAMHAQWDRLQTWLEDSEESGVLDVDVPSALPGWSTGELVSHLGRAMDALGVCVAAPDGTHPLTLAEYLGTYPDRGDEITRVTRELDAELVPDRVAGVARLARHALANLDDLGPGDIVVQARRGPIRLHDMVLSRLVELVVHADDLARSLPGAVAVSGPPVDPEALRLVADELLHVVVVRGGYSLLVDDPLLWTRLATGRVPYHVDLLAEALATPSSADAVPDLGRALPLL
ncbi:maleylpyruvate isomerase N-terminal domain-containing protein [Luteimicrobium subarcticum]|uniref:Uncharacterized protein (TIGR03083 family) n=1 Tax=Luteimicrobium subarcticum TaxID=620910 RepID=A0A2M8WSM6_9MICO|nr:maleylpyruvate isomerase N-terminal domain-containing protein [Luteimicrobium subarcticum]PJI93930.1 uncharacterized protein (TIGR03083 family) [Luteimicrobium subarcticum]